MLLDEGDRVRLVTPAPQAGTGKPGRARAGERLPRSPQSWRPRCGRPWTLAGPCSSGAAVYWQIGDGDSGREFYRELLDGIASAGPAMRTCTRPRT